MMELLFVVLSLVFAKYSYFYISAKICFRSGALIEPFS